MVKQPLRKCRECGLEAFDTEDLVLFVKDSKLPYNRQTLCKDCKAVSQKRRDVKHSYGISLEEYNECMETSVVCECCGKDSELCYDHIHDTNEFRGVLCKQCNYGIGLLGDTEEGILNALSYFRSR